jgi:hypothetical protein
MLSRPSNNRHPASPFVLLLLPLAQRYSLVKKLDSLVKKLAGQMLARPALEAERHLAFELERHRRILRRRQLSNEMFEAQVGELQGAVRGELWRAVMAPLQPRENG